MLDIRVMFYKNANLPMYQPLIKHLLGTIFQYGCFWWGLVSLAVYRYIYGSIFSSHLLRYLWVLIFIFKWHSCTHEIGTLFWHRAKECFMWITVTKIKIHIRYITTKIQHLWNNGHNCYLLTQSQGIIYYMHKAKV